MVKYQSYIRLVLFLGLIILSFFVIKPFLIAILIGALLAYLFSGLHNSLQKKIKNKTTPALIICVVVLILLVVVSIFFTNTLVKESYVLFVMGKQKLATGLFTNCENSFCQSVKEFGQDPTLRYQIQDSLKSITNWVIQRGSNFLISIPRFMLNLFVVFFTMFYFLKGGDKMLMNFEVFFRKKKYAIIVKRLREIIHGVVYGYLLIAFIQGAVGGLGFFLFGISSPLFWGVVMGFMALIPLLGTGLIWVPAALFILLDGMFQDSSLLIFKGIGLFLYGLILISGIDNILRPKLMSQKANVHPVVILLGIIGGIFTFGPFGVIIGPLILSLTVVFMEIYLIRGN